MKRKMLSVFLIILSLFVLINTAFAACSHSWSSWEIYNTELGASALITGCMAIYEDMERFCYNCYEFQYTTQRTELPHIWQAIDNYTAVCTRCGSTSGLAK